jgi:hypothetical protein
MVAVARGGSLSRGAKHCREKHEHEQGRALKFGSWNQESGDVTRSLVHCLLRLQTQRCGHDGTGAGVHNAVYGTHSNSACVMRTALDRS